MSNESMKREAENEKENGNKHFKSGNYLNAINCYTKAIQLNPTNAVFYCNRAIAYLKNGLAIEAQNDCNTAINIDNSCVKAYFRRGVANKHLHRYHLALEDFNTVLKLEPNNTEAVNEIKHIKTLFDSKAMIEIKPISEQNQLNSNSALVNIPIVNIESLKISDIELKLPQNVPQNYYQFECDWRELIGHNYNQLRLKYLQMIGSDHFSHIFSSTIEPNILSDIINALLFCEDINFIYDLLYKLTQIPRFETLVMFFSDTDKNALKSMFQHLSQSNNLLADKKQNIGILAKLYLIEYNLIV